MQKNLVVGQSGGPSVAINASLAGVIRAALDSGKIDTVYGMRNGVEGLLTEDLISLNYLNRPQFLAHLKATPAMALGSCRYKLPETDQEGYFRRIVEILHKYNIGYFLYIGGNDSMDTVKKLSAYCTEHEHDIMVMGVPKTIDNDLMHTDHTPGFGSAAKYLAVTVDELIMDTDIYFLQSVTIVEVMGRNAGWLTLASALPRFLGKERPQIICLPEQPFDEEDFLQQIHTAFQKSQCVLAVVSEGIRDKNGDYVGASFQNGVTDQFGHAYLQGVGKYLETLVRERIGCKVRSIEVNLMQRCAIHLASRTDLDEAYEVGRRAVQFALEGVTGKTVVYRRISNRPYRIDYDAVDVERIANREKKVPEKWLDFDDPATIREILDYLLPLIQGDVPQVTDAFGLPSHLVIPKE